MQSRPRLRSRGGGSPVSAVLIPKPEDLAPWCASIGRTAADCAALLFRLPMPASAYAICERQIRAHVAAELVELGGLMDVERQHFENIAWLAFDRRLSHHTAMLPFGGVA